MLRKKGRPLRKSARLNPTLTKSVNGAGDEVDHTHSDENSDIQQFAPQVNFQKRLSSTDKVNNDLLAATLVKLLRKMDFNSVSIPKLDLNSSAQEMNKWINSVLNFEKSHELSESELLDITRKSLSEKLTNTLVALYGAEKFYNCTRQEMEKFLRDLLNPEISVLSKSSEAINCRQFSTETVTEYFLRKSNLIDHHYPGINEEMKIGYIFNGLQFSVRQALENHNAVDSVSTVKQLFNLLQRIEKKLNNAKSTNNYQRKSYLLNKAPENNKWPSNGNEKQSKPDEPVKQKFEKKIFENTNLQHQKTFRRFDENEKNWKKKFVTPTETHQKDTFVKKNAKIVCGKCGKQNHAESECYRNSGNKTLGIITNVNTVQKSLTANVEINSKTVKCLIDSGADLSFINSEVARKCNLQLTSLLSNPNTVMGFNGNHTTLNTIADVSFSFHDNDVQLQLYAIPNLSTDVILGCDFLSKYKLSPDIHNQCLWQENDNGILEKLLLNNNSNDTEFDEIITSDESDVEAEALLREDEHLFSVLKMPKIFSYVENKEKYRLITA
ncbi:hypothetical protein B4U80_13553, partial [Leptotrombidium deliense]